MSEYTIDASEFRDAAARLERAGFSKAAGRTVAYALRRVGNIVRNKARANLAPHRRTGKMRDRVRVTVKGAGMDSVVRTEARGGANLIAGGVRPHTITAGGKVMPIWSGSGKWKRGEGRGITGFARLVEHPGFRADPFFSRAIEDARPEASAIFDKSAETMASELAYRMRGKG